MSHLVGKPIGKDIISKACERKRERKSLYIIWVLSLSVMWRHLLDINNPKRPKSSMIYAYGFLRAKLQFPG